MKVLRSVVGPNIPARFPNATAADFDILRTFNCSIDTSAWFLLTVAEAL